MPGAHRTAHASTRGFPRSIRTIDHPAQYLDQGNFEQPVDRQAPAAAVAVGFCELEVQGAVQSPMADIGTTITGGSN
jgi:hypothetical protein